MTIQKKRYIEIALFIAVLVLGLYLNTLDNEATNWDDPALFSRTALHEITKDNLKNVLAVTSLSTYQPVRDLTYMADFALWGPSHKAVTFGIHLQSMLLYLLMILACWLFLLELFKLFLDDHDMAFTWATLSAILYAVHPVHVESVAWLYARKEPLLGIFTFLSMWAFIRARTGRWAYFIASGTFMILAILSKPTAIVIPAVMIVLDFAIQSRQKSPSFWKTRILMYLPVLAFVVFMGIRLVTMMDTAGGVKPYHGGSFWTNLLAVSHILVEYFSLIGFTINYAADYPIELFADPHAWQSWAVVALNALLVTSAVLAYWKKHYLYAFFVVWYYVFLLPVAHIFPISQNLADRYALLSSLTWCILLGYLFSRLWHWRLTSSRLSPEFPLLVSVAFFSVVVLSYSYMTFRQNDIWKNSQTLWEDTLAKYPNSSPGNVNLAAIYLAQMRFPEVQDLCIAAIKEKPYDYLAISNLALAQMMMGQYDNAINNYRQALKLKPDLTKATKGLAHAYWKNKDYVNAYVVYSEILKRGLIGGQENIIEQFYRTGFSAWKAGKTDEAATYLDQAMKYADQDAGLLDDIAVAYTSMGDFAKARNAFAELYPRIKDGESKEKLAHVLEQLDKVISRQTAGAGQGAKP